MAAAADLAAGRIALTGQEGRHASNARRLAPGERADLTDGAGTVAECVVTGAWPGRLELTVLSKRAEPRPEPAVTVVQAIPKGERAEFAVDLVTQVGADTVVPWAAQLCVAQWRGERAAKALNRWRSAAAAAAKQSRRAWFPEVTQLADLAAVTNRVGAAALGVVLDPEADVALGDLVIPQAGEIVIVVGPEGGITPLEREALLTAGGIPARLGPTILRASSAGAVAVGVILASTARWR